jgi:hypothetical protein
MLALATCLATPGFAASVTVTDTSTLLPNAANDTTALLLDAGLTVTNAGGGKYIAVAKNFHCDERNDGALGPADVNAGLETLQCRINSQNQKGTKAGTPFGDQRALRHLLQTIQHSSAAGGTVFTDCAMGYDERARGHALSRARG